MFPLKGVIGIHKGLGYHLQGYLHFEWYIGVSIVLGSPEQGFHEISAS